MCDGLDEKKLEALFISDKDECDTPKPRPLTKTRTEILEEMGLPKELKEIEYILRRMETATISLRNLLITTPYFEGVSFELEDEKYKREMMDYEKKLYGMEIAIEDNIVKIMVPAIIPHRRARTDSVYDSTLREYLFNFETENKPFFTQFREDIKEGAVVVVEHSYKMEWMVRDNDNIELKRIIDLLVQTGFLLSDRGTRLKLFLTAKQDESEDSRATIHIMPKHLFPKFLETHGI